MMFGFCVTKSPAWADLAQLTNTLSFVRCNTYLQVIRLRVPAKRGVLWQKERLLNIGIERAPAHCRKIVWADLDIDFVSDSWVHDLSEALERHDVVQPFAWAYRMLAGESTPDRIAPLEQSLAREAGAASTGRGRGSAIGAAGGTAGGSGGGDGDGGGDKKSPVLLSELRILTTFPAGAMDGQMLHSAGFGLSVLRNMNRSEDGVDARLRGHSGCVRARLTG